MSPATPETRSRPAVRDTPPPRRSRTFAVIAGGGTGGHVIPAIAIAQALVARGHPPETIHFVGSRRGLEARLVPAAGFGVTLLPGRGVVRRLRWQNVGALLGLLKAVGSAVVLLFRLRPAVVISVGGYASVGAVVAAAVLRRPLVVTEQNAAPGAANRLAARVAKACAISFPGTPLPRAVLTGNPVRAEILALDRSASSRREARALLELPEDRTVVLVTGGSLGARSINTATLELVRSWAGRDDIAVRHVIGERDWEALGDELRSLERGELVYQAIGYEDRMDVAYRAADVAVVRAGGSTAELAVAGLPAVLVPLPGAPGDHQTANARSLAKAGAAVVIADAELSGSRLAEELDRLITQPERLVAMGAAARQLARPDAADAVAALAEEYARA